MRQFGSTLLAMSIWAAMLGCGGPRPVTGGTPGVLHAGTGTLSDIQVTVHEIDGTTSRPIGFAITDSNGEFELVTNGAQGPLLLSAGEYRCTLESAGAPVQLPIEYAKAETTPLKISWSDDTVELNLEIPVPPPVK